MTVRIIFEELEDIRYISHLDLIRTFNRMLFRSGLPVKHSEGFNPHILLNIALPLPVGVISKREVADLELTRDLETEEIKAALEAVAPLGIKIKEVTKELFPQFKNIAKADYEIKIKCKTPKEKIGNFLESKEIITPKRTKKGVKDVDIKPLIYNYSVSENDGLLIAATLAAGSALNLNPLLLIKTMESGIEGFEPEETEVVRICFMSDKNEIF